MSADKPEPLAFYCMSSDIYFLAAVGLVNSLRITGHEAPIYLLDLGLTPEQRRLLEPEVRIVPAPESAPPFLLKAHAPRRHPAEVQVLADADMVVCAPLEPLIAAAGEGKVVAGATGLDRHREEWSELLDLGPLADLPYLSSALLALGGELGHEIVALVDERSDRVDYERTYFRSDDPGYPLLHAEEDVINAAVRARASAEQVVGVRGAPLGDPPVRGPPDRRRGRPALRLRRRDEPLRRPSLARQAVARADPRRGLLAPFAQAAHRRRRSRSGPRPVGPASVSPRAAPLDGAQAHRPPRARADAPLKAAFYCVADARYFLGAVALVNSLRMVGHEEPILLLDCGLTSAQRELLEREVTLVEAPTGAPPQVLKAIAPLRHPARTALLIDVDMIATRSLAALIDRAAPGGVAAFADRQQRFFPEWGELLGLGDAEPRPYVSSGLVACGGEVGERVLALLEAGGSRVDFGRTFWGENDRDYPFLYADQDVLNAILATTVEPERVHVLEERLAATPPFRGLKVDGEEILRCRYGDGERPYVVHQYARKPWLEETYDGVYSRLLRQMLLCEGIAIRPPADEIPLHLREGPAARARRRRINTTDFLRWHFGDRLPRPIAHRVEDLRRRREASGR